MTGPDATIKFWGKKKRNQGKRGGGKGIAKGRRKK